MNVLAHMADCWFDFIHDFADDCLHAIIGLPTCIILGFGCGVYYLHSVLTPSTTIPIPEILILIHIPISLLITIATILAFVAAWQSMTRL